MAAHSWLKLCLWYVLFRADKCFMVRHLYPRHSITLTTFPAEQAPPLLQITRWWGWHRRTKGGWCEEVYTVSFIININDQTLIYSPMGFPIQIHLVINKPEAHSLSCGQLSQGSRIAMCYSAGATLLMSHNYLPTTENVLLVVTNCRRRH